MDGLAAPLSALQAAAGAAEGVAVRAAADALLRRLSGRPSKQAEEQRRQQEQLTQSSGRPAGSAAASAAVSAGMAGASGADASSRSWIRRLLNADREALLADERAALGIILAFLEVRGAEGREFGGGDGSAMWTVLAFPEVGS